LETIREFGLEQLVLSGEDEETRHHHAVFCLELAENGCAGLKSLDEVVWLDRLDAEADNLRAALAWGVERNSELTARLAVASTGYWIRRGHLSEGRGWLTPLLEQRGTLPEPARLEMLFAASCLAGLQGDSAQERALIEEVYALARDLDDEGSVANACINLGTVAVDAGDYIQAEQWLSQAAEIHQRTEDKRGAAGATLNLGVVAALKGDPNTALKRFGESKVLSQHIGDRRGEAEALDCIGQTTIDFLRDASRAAPALAEALDIYRTLRDPIGIAYCLQGFAKVAALTDHFEAAARLDGAAEILREMTGAPMVSFMTQSQQRAMDATREQLGKEAFSIAWEAGRALPLNEVVAGALALADELAMSIHTRNET